MLKWKLEHELDVTYVTGIGRIKKLLHLMKHL